ncbi:MAG: sigma-70 family RNA polymerase sigma factor [Gemmatimonadaceae bacterium]|nr:sigma-70 family RNA polymerase sigma factor [Gemmatimonadaceae bacterium]NUO95647.1 sigma-70 family RNA polymerase sigma factor [Gemmatimonadaceae bacterium]NUP56600.1 sigma-70 family RNA polymerase sigma factor [Gemmatimonadaceae bacterium]
MTDETRRARDHEFRAEALRWLPEVTRFALSLTRDESDADDLVQETFLKAYEAWATYTPGTECRGWLFTICRHTFYRRRRREERQVTCDDPEVEALAAAAVHASARQGGYADLFTRFDLSDAIDGAIAALPEAFREVVLLVDVNDQSYEAAAEMLSVPLGTVRSRLFRARRLLQEALIDHARDAGRVRPRVNADANRQES